MTDAENAIETRPSGVLKSRASRPHLFMERRQQRRHWRAPKTLRLPHSGQRVVRGFFLIFSTDLSGLKANRNSRTSLSLARFGHSRPRRSHGQKNDTFPGFVVLMILNCLRLPHPYCFCSSAHLMMAMPLIFIGHQTMPVG
jgi:hypothetical protein